MTSSPPYPPTHYRETRRETIVDFIREIGFGQLVTVGEARPYATSVPFLVREEGETAILEAHLQRGNPQWMTVRGEALALFQGPHAYVRPGWYENKQQHGRVVPTWNYIVVQALGPLEVIDDPQWVRAHVTALTAVHEAGRPQPWTPGDAPEGFIDVLLRGIVGVRLTVRAFDGRWKLNQNHPKANRRGVIAGLRASERPGDQEVADIMSGLEGAGP